MSALNRFQKFYVLTVGIFLAWLALSSKAFPATYNFYFNNNEQGDNSTSTPTVIVKDGKEVKEVKPEAGTPVKEETLPETKAQEGPEPASFPATQGEAPSPGSPSVTSSNEDKIEVLRRSYFDKSRFRITAGMAAAQARGANVQDNWEGSYDHYTFDDWEGYYSGESKRNWRGPSMSVSFFPLQNLGATLFGNSEYQGLELEGIPTRIGTSFEMGVLVGATLIETHLTAQDVYPHFGLRFALDLDKNWGITLAARRTFDTSEFGARLQSLEGGLMLRL